jgi:Holliday junction resolvase RusA-like endonuclease
MIDKEEDYEFWISGNTPSSKNSRINTGNYSFASKSTQAWIKQTRVEWINQARWFQYMASILPKPIHVVFTFHRKARRKFDYINIAQAVLDQMEHYKWIVDDNADEIKPYFGDYMHDPKYPGVHIRILKTKPIL